MKEMGDSSEINHKEDIKFSIIKPAHNEEKYIGPLLIKYGAISVGIFWCYKKDFESINGFNENMLMAEDADFAKRLKEWGKKNGKKYGTISNGMITSCRKFDKHGDWVLLKRPKAILAYLKGTDQKYADEAYYENDDR